MKTIDIVAAEPSTARGLRASDINRRMGIAVFAAAGMFIALYLTLTRLGLLGPLACTLSGCQAVQFSPWSKLLGVPVPYMGTVAYGAITLIATAGTTAKWSTRPGVALALAILGLVVLCFAIYNTSVEVFVIHAFCPWCIACAACGLGIHVLSVPEWFLRARLN